MQVADRISQMTNQTEKAAVAQEVFGRSGMKLLPILSQGQAGIQGMIEEADKLGVTMDEKDADAAEGFHKSLLKIEAVFQGIMQSSIMPLIEELAPTIESLAQSIGKILVPVLELLKPLLQFTAEMMKVIAEVIGAVVGGIAEAFGATGTEYSSHPAGRGYGGRGGETTVNVQVSPEDSARHVANQIAPVIVHSVNGVQHAVQTSTRREMQRQSFQDRIGRM